MFNQPQPVSPSTAQDYLAWEVEQEGKHEYYYGEIFAMGGASRRHVTVALNVAADLNEQLAGSPCRAYMADMMVEAVADEVYYYPDVFVTCDPTDHRADRFMRSPVLVVEVLSPSTEAYDRGEKFAKYRLISSLREYVLIDPERLTVEAYRRTGEGVWTLRDVPNGEPLYLDGLKLEIAWQRMFRNVAE
ncbi:Uma2 family endonuclease [Desulfonatronum thioautotrophicum]|uniref:Uma2 family endonuclease n=1 Tax=Desulfonatronum thioautotrophicum TaxID=617001 RepID=UPI0005EB10F7|nr:Uma2 family endonuclease [Desulfonatronum thioautotrophicum]